MNESLRNLSLQISRETVLKFLISFFNVLTFFALVFQNVEFQL